MDRKFIGVDIGGTSVKLGIIDESGKVLAKSETEYKSDVMNVVKNAIRELLGREGMSIEDISGIGVSAAGCINSVTGSVANNGGNIPDWAHTEVCKELKEEFGLPATLANDANCTVMGENWIGAAKGYTDVLAVALGTGVGGGVITGGRLLEGSRGYAGEIGHFATHVGGTHCVCGLDGCYERYASTSALTRASESANPDWNNGRVFFKAVADGDETAKKILADWINEIAYGIAGFVHVFDPQLVLIGGGVSKQEELLIKPLKARVLELVMPDFATGLEFKAASVGNDAAMLGAVYYFLSKENVEHVM